MHKITLVYNERTYHLSPRDIPTLRGSGKIIIRKGDGFQEQVTEGNFSNISCSQGKSSSYINGINIESLIKRLETRR